MNLYTKHKILGFLLAFSSCLLFYLDIRSAHKQVEINDDFEEAMSYVDRDSIYKQLVLVEEKVNKIEITGVDFSEDKSSHRFINKLKLAKYIFSDRGDNSKDKMSDLIELSQAKSVVNGLYPSNTNSQLNFYSPIYGWGGGWLWFLVLVLLCAGLGSGILILLVSFF